jgi:hypothetical protein
VLTLVQMISSHDVAARLGVKPGTVYYWLRTGEIPTANRPPAQSASHSPPTSKPHSALGQQLPASLPELN